MIIIILLFLGFLIIEINHIRNISSPLIINPYNWYIYETTEGIEIQGNIELENKSKRIEFMIPEIKVCVKPLDFNYYNDLEFKVNLYSQHQDEQNREDNYWQAYVMKRLRKTNIKALIASKIDNNQRQNIPKTFWISVECKRYGPFGILNQTKSFVISNRISKKDINSNIIKSQKNINYEMIPIRTHILGSQDDICSTIKYYTEDIIKSDDIVAIGETPIAIMQGRYLDAMSLNISFIAKLLCIPFHPTSSLASAGGMQALINIYGPTRITFSILLGTISKIFRIKGVFYRLAGKQARLIDDITGTTPPYDKSIVLGPCDPKKICDEIYQQLNTRIAIVDVNDLGKVKILAASHIEDKQIIMEALRSNPAGNGSEQTPIVLIRPVKNFATDNSLNNLDF
tara:strand:- start:4527 stop:5723 length:1197 start_codon:yes stop_codon:yes gene_type:complete